MALISHRRLRPCEKKILFCSLNNNYLDPTTYYFVRTRKIFCSHNILFCSLNLLFCSHNISYCSLNILFCSHNILSCSINILFFSRSKKATSWEHSFNIGPYRKYIQKSSPQKLLGQLEPNLVTIVLEWSPFKSASDRCGPDP